MDRTVYELTVSSEEQVLSLSNGWQAEIFFDRCYKRWYYNLYRDSVLVAAGIALNPDTAPLLGFTNESLGLVENVKKGVEYEPFLELGSGLLLMEISQ